MGFLITWKDKDILKLIKGGGVDLDHSPRLYEVEMATQMGIPFDDNWYKIPKITREQHIAGHLARISIENVMAR